MFDINKDNYDEFIKYLYTCEDLKYKDKTLKFLNINTLDKWTYNKTIQKIIESNRVEKQEKLLLKGMKIK